MFRFKTFSRPGNPSVFAQEWFDLLQYVTKDMAGHYHQQIAAGSNRIRQIIGQLQGIRKRNIRQKFLITAIFL